MNKVKENQNLIHLSESFLKALFILFFSKLYLSLCNSTEASKFSMLKQLAKQREKYKNKKSKLV
jgi:hypothetical protein